MLQRCIIKETSYYVFPLFSAPYTWPGRFACDWQFAIRAAYLTLLSIIQVQSQSCRYWYNMHLCIIDYGLHRIFWGVKIFHWVMIFDPLYLVSYTWQTVNIDAIFLYGVVSENGYYDDAWLYIDESYYMTWIVIHMIPTCRILCSQENVIVNDWSKNNA